MRLLLGLLQWATLAALLLIPIACVDPEEISVQGTNNVIVVDGTITNLAEPQLIRLNRSVADRLTGRFGVLPITKASVVVIVDSSLSILCHETIDGTYQLPSDFKGQVGHAYQLRFTLSDGTQYVSTQQVMPREVAINRVSQRFSSTSLATGLLNGNSYRGASELFVDWQDPVDQHNYYQWSWKLWENQEWCRQCSQGFYYVWQPYNFESDLLEDCQATDPYQLAQIGAPYFINDYQCRTQCWEILYSYDINVFDDASSNGGYITNRRIAQIPYYQALGCLVEIRQSSLSREAYTYFSLFQRQTQNTGGLADTPPTALIGNVRNVSNSREPVIGYFTASGVFPTRYWLDRRDATGIAPGLFEALHGGFIPSTENLTRDPNTNQLKFSLGLPPGSKNALSRPPTALCIPSNSRTPYKPEGWRD